MEKYTQFARLEIKKMSEWVLRRNTYTFAYMHTYIYSHTME